MNGLTLNRRAHNYVHYTLVYSRFRPFPITAVLARHTIVDSMTHHLVFRHGTYKSVLPQHRNSTAFAVCVRVLRSITITLRYLTMSVRCFG